MSALTTELRKEILSVPEEHLAHATADELQLYEDCLKVEVALSRPLNYMREVNKRYRAYKHIRLLDEWMVALEEGRLYFDGPGPTPKRLHRTTARVRPYIRRIISGFDDEGYAYTEDGEDDETGEPLRISIFVHPTRGDRPVYNLGIDMPPRHGKSYYVSHHHPAYFLTKYPDYSFILASYEADFAASWGGKARDVITEFTLPGIEVVGGTQAARKNWQIKGHAGEMFTAGAGGPVTGKGGHWIVVDDPVKNAEEALSETSRESAYDWFVSTLYTRREPWDDGTPGRVVLMATRWHEDDLSGRVIPEVPKLGDEWARLHLQAIFEPTDDYPVDPLGRKQGESLCPQRVPLVELEKIREVLGEVWFGALYQGDPFVSDGNHIHRPFHYATIKDGVYTLTTDSGEVLTCHEDDCYRFISVDLAGSEKKHADYSVFMVLDVTNHTPRRMIVRDVFRKKVDTANHEGALADFAERWDPAFIGIEDKTFGTNLANLLIAKGGYSIRKFDADKHSKIWRAMPIDNSIRNGLLFFMEKANWRPEFEKELIKFPYSKNDDQTDALAHANNYFRKLPQKRRRKQPAGTLEEQIREHALAKHRARGRGGFDDTLGKW